MKTKLLLYCTKAKPYLADTKTETERYYCHNTEKGSWGNVLNGKIVAECECDVEEFEWWSNSTYDDGYFNKYGKDITKELCKKSCLTYEQLFNYIGGVNDGYALHLNNLKMFEKPLELSECYKTAKCDYGYYNSCLKVEKAPQNMQIVYYKGQVYVLISIRPEWLCKILNGEKTIEVRRKILKGMM